MSDKSYLGDSVYVKTEHGMVKLTTNNGRFQDAEIWLEPEVVEAFLLWLKVREERKT